jgi:uncharacterized ion transporter superfamily protein YfcC
MPDLPPSTPAAADKNQPRAWRMPDTYIILFLIILLAGLTTWVVPVGTFDFREVEGKNGTREVVDPDSFELLRNAEGALVYHRVSLFRGEADGGERIIHRLPGGGQGDIGVMNFIFEGMVSGSKYGAAVGVIAFILVIGGSFGIILRTGAVENAILWVIHKVGGRAVLIIPVLFILFSLGGAIFGMGEEAIAFAMIVCPLMIALGYDSVTGLLVTYVATQIGFATSWMNPFSVAVAQGIAEVPVLSGTPFRMGMWATFTAVGVAYTLWYAYRVRTDPKRSANWEMDRETEKEYHLDRHEAVQFRLGDAFVMMTLLLGLIWVIYGVMAHQYYIPEIATQFFVIGVVSGIIGVVFKLNGMNWNTIPESFRHGAGNLLGAALIVGMAKGILLILGGDDPTRATVLNTILHYSSSLIGEAPAVLSAWFMFLFQSLFNFFVSSGSGQAALTMPLMAPLADLVGVSRQVSVLAFQLGDGLTNLIIPTSAALMGSLGVARMDWMAWLKTLWKFQLFLMLLASLFVIGAVLLGLQ